jgi:hypothetical protein
MKDLKEFCFQSIIFFSEGLIFTRDLVQWAPGSELETEIINLNLLSYESLRINQNFFFYKCGLKVEQL